MLSNQLLSYDEKRNIQKTIFEDIELEYKRLNEIKNLGELLSMDLPMPSYANFRDALFHYTKIYESSDLFTVNGNIYMLREHLLRSLKDSIIALTNELVGWIEYFCIKHSINHNLENVINKEFPQFNDIKNWNVKLFREIRNYLLNNFQISHSETNCQCLKHSVCIVQNTNVTTIARLRYFMHCLKNHNHKIRSASSILAKPYSSDDEFNTLLKDIHDFYKLAQKTNILCTFYWFVGIE